MFRTTLKFRFKSATHSNSSACAPKTSSNATRPIITIRVSFHDRFPLLVPNRCIEDFLSVMSSHKDSTVLIQLCKVAIFLANELEWLTECFVVDDVSIVCVLAASSVAIRVMSADSLSAASALVVASVIWVCCNAVWIVLHCSASPLLPATASAVSTAVQSPPAPVSFVSLVAQRDSTTCAVASSATPTIGSLP